MKKRFFLILTVLALLLAGCGVEMPGGTAGTTEPAQTTVPQTTAAPGLYDPDSAWEGMTHGAVRAYALEESCAGIAPMGDGLLLFHYGEKTTLTLVTGEELVTAARAEIGGEVYYGDTGISVRADGVTYYDMEDHTIVTLNALLQETSRVAMPAVPASVPVIDEAGKLVYYSVGQEIRELDLQTGISRLLRQESSEDNYVQGLYCSGTVLWVDTFDEYGAYEAQFLSTENGMSLYEGSSVTSLRTEGDWYYAELTENVTGEWVFGQTDQEVSSFDPTGVTTWVQWLPQQHSAVNWAGTENGWSLDCYDLSTGLRTASLNVPETTSPTEMIPDPTGEYLWFLDGMMENGALTLCRWEVSRSGVSDAQVYVGKHYTAEYPDEVGLTQCQAEAARIGEAYGVEILVWEDAMQFQPGDYTLGIEYRADLIGDSLKALEKALARFPEGFLQTAAAQSDYGKIRISLVGSIQGDPKQGTLDSVNGIQYWYGVDPVIALTVSDGVEQAFYHEMSHVIETRVLNETTIYDGWEKLNPKGFKYDYDYITNLDRTDTTYLEGENRAFVDFYAMSYPKEDRARLMEYAMLEGDEEMFESEWMQRKLNRLCRGIRKAFGLSKYAEVLPWEQYLETSLVP